MTNDKTTYFLAYAYESSRSSGFGNCTISLPRIMGIQDIHRIESLLSQDLSKKMEDDTSVVLINWKVI